MVNLGETRVNHKIGTSGGIDASDPSRATLTGGHLDVSREAVTAVTTAARARTAPARVSSLTKRHAERPACLFSAPAVACPPGSGILAVAAGVGQAFPPHVFAPSFAPR